MLWQNFALLLKPKLKALKRLLKKYYVLISFVVIYTLFELMCWAFGFTDNLQQQYKAQGVVYNREAVQQVPNPDKKYHYYPQGWVGLDESWRDDVDSLGFMGNTLGAADSNQYRVLGLGDSFTEGCCPETQPSFGQRLADDSDIAFYNTGINGAGVYDYLQKTEYLIPYLDSSLDAVAIFWCWNDVSAFRFRKGHPLRYYVMVDERSAIIPGGIVDMDGITNYYNADTASMADAYRFYREVNAVWLLPGGGWWGQTFIGSWVAGEIMSADGSGGWWNKQLFQIGRVARGRYSLQCSWWDMLTDDRVKQVQQEATQLDSIRLEFANDDLKKIQFTAADIYEKDFYIFLIPHPSKLDELNEGIPTEYKPIFRGLEEYVHLPIDLTLDDYHTPESDPYRHFNDSGHEKFYVWVKGVLEDGKK